MRTVLAFRFADLFVDVFRVGGIDAGQMMGAVMLRLAAVVTIGGSGGGGGGCRG